MPLVTGGEGHRGRPSPDPPEDAVRYEVTHKRIRVSRTRHEAFDPDAGRLANQDAEDVIYYEGEELPPELAEEVYPAFHDRIACFDEDDQRVDE